MMKLSKRLQAVADMIPKCHSIADICSDHAFLPIYCVKQNICTTAIAGDIAKGPCEQGIRQVDKYDLSEFIEVRCGSGLTVIKPNEVSGVVMAGVGGTTIIEIIEESIEVARSLEFMVLQPQNGFSTLRNYLMNNNYQICDENLVDENEIIYQIMLVKKGSMIINGHLQSYYGSINLNKRTDELYKLLSQDLNHYYKVMEQLKAGNGNKLIQKKNEIKSMIGMIEEVLNDKI